MVDPTIERAYRDAVMAEMGCPMLDDEPEPGEEDEEPSEPVADRNAAGGDHGRYD